MGLHRSPTLPLGGIRVLDLTWLLPGPYCTLILADLGADVVKIERPGSGDYTRDMLPGVYYMVNRNKRSLGLNLKDEEAKSIFFRLVDGADVVIEGFRPGVVDRLGIGPDTLQQRNRGLIFVSISGYGQTGPYKDRPGHDINYLAAAGALSVPGRWGEPPQRSGLPVADLASAMFAVISILAALRLRDQTGQGTYLDVSMTDAVLSWSQVRLGDVFVTGQGELPDYHQWQHLQPANDIFVTADGRWLALGVMEDVFWQNLCRALDRLDWLEDPNWSSPAGRRDPCHGGRLKKLLAEVLSQRSLAEWEQIFDQHDVPYSPVATPNELLHSEHFRQRRMFSQVYVPQLQREIAQVEFPVPMPRVAQHSPPPALGQHTLEILQELGLEPEQIEQLRQRGAVC